MNLFMDIETIPDQRTGALDAILAGIKPPAQYKKAESIQRWIDEHAEAVAVEEWKKTALKGIAGEIISIAWAFEDEDVDGIVGGDIPEEKILLGFFDAIHEHTHRSEGRFPRIRWIGHNVIDFDLRFLYQRSVIRGVAPGLVLPTEARHASESVYDTMKAWSGWRDRAKLDDICDAVGIRIDGDPGLDGSMVWDLVQAGAYETVLEYNKVDVEKVRQLYGRLKWLL